MSQVKFQAVVGEYQETPNADGELVATLLEHKKALSKHWDEAMSFCKGLHKDVPSMSLGRLVKFYFLHGLTSKNVCGAQSGQMADDLLACEPFWEVAFKLVDKE